MDGQNRNREDRSTPPKDGQPAGAMPLRGDGRWRQLVCIPIVHTAADMGTLAESVRTMAEERLGTQGWNDNLDAIERFWHEVTREILSWDLPFPKVRLYQDGLPVCGKELQIAEDLASSGSLNHKLLLELAQRGAILMGTESPELLLEEYGHIREALQASTGSAECRNRSTGKDFFIRKSVIQASLLEHRDRFIAQRIDETLLRCETGLLFIGMLHQPERWLSPSIHTAYPFGRPGATQDRPASEHGRLEPQGKGGEDAT